MDGNTIDLRATASARRLPPAATAAAEHEAEAAAPAATASAPRYEVERVESAAWIQLGSIRSFEWNRVTVRFEHLPAAVRGMRVMHFSDLHMRAAWYPAYDRLLGRLEADPPDLIVVSGDFVENRADHRTALPYLRRFIEGLRSRLGIWGILGNHDGDLLGPRLRDWGVHLLPGRLARLQNHEASVELLGIPSVSREDLERWNPPALPPLQASVPRLVLSHFPDSVEKLNEIDGHVILAGHTHGGQVCLPGGRPIITHDGLPKHMSKGVHDIGGGKLLVVHRGMGFASLPMRVFCPPEVIELRLEKG